ncbi:ribosomal maturation YjgA family protein [Pontimicrobium sp. MEBiC01747]
MKSFKLMVFRFNIVYFILFLILLIIEILIATFLKSGFIRHTFGDFLVVILLYTLIKSILKTKSLYIALAVLIIAFSIEFLQLANLLDYLNLRDNLLANLILGSHFSIQDLIAYTLGVICSFLIDKKLSKHA